MKLHPLIWKVLNFAQNEGLFSRNDKIILSVSGGLDSTFMLHVFNQIRTRFPLKLHIAHFHHGIRKESDDEARFVESLALQADLPFTLFKSSKLNDIKGMQEKARNWRQEKLTALKEEKGYDFIAQAHHLDDLVETQLWRMIRGASLFQLHPIKPLVQHWIHPLLELRKSDIKNFMESEGLNWKEDSSNQTTDYTRNTIRNKLIPLIHEISGPRFEEKMEQLSYDAKALNDLFQQSIPDHLYKTEQLKKTDIQRQPEIFGREIIHRFLIHNQITEINRKQIDEIYTLALSDKGQWQVSLHGNTIIKENKGLLKLIH